MGTMVTRLNIGCGMSPTSGWINYDNSPAVRVSGSPALVRALRAVGVMNRGHVEFAAFCRSRGIRFANAVSRIPHSDRSVDAIYSSHMIEHLDRLEARRFLAECRRVLRPGGILRIVVPDLRVTVNDYVTKGNADVFLDHLQLDLDKPHGFAGHVRNILIGGRNHHWLYDGPSMQKLLGECGFDEAETLQPGRTKIAEPGELDLFERAGESAYVEGRRPG